jgi:4-amino-4-deoxy-L-arabinose transferase-like glycosyltransferase
MADRPTTARAHRSPSQRIAGSAKARPLAGWVLAALVALMCLGGALRLFRLSHQSLWTDEIVTYISAEGTPWRVITQEDENSNIPPLYYLVANASLSLQPRVDVETALRLPSVLVGVLSIPLLFLVVLPWLGQQVALFAAALLAISPFHIWYSQEARPYALLLFLSLVALACVQQALQHPARRWWKAAAAVALASTFYCHTVGIGFIAFAAAYVLVDIMGSVRGGWSARGRAAWASLRRGQLRQWAITFAGVVVISLPGVWRLVVFPPDASADAARAVSPLQLGYALWSFVVGYSFGPSLSELHAGDLHAVVLQHASSVLPVAAGVFVLLVLGIRTLVRDNPRLAVVIALWFVFPVAFVVAGALVTVHPFNVRYSVISFLPITVVLVVGLDALPGLGSRAAAWAGVVTLCAVALWQYYDNPAYARDDNRGAVHYYMTHAHHGEPVIARRAFTYSNFAFYAPADTRIIPYPVDERPIADFNVEQDMTEIVRGAPRFWLFLSRGTPADYAPLIAYCDHVYRRDTTASYTAIGVELMACVRRSTNPDGPDRSQTSGASSP